MGTNYNPQIVTSGLILALDAANPKSYPGFGLTWTDISNNGNSVYGYNSPIFDGTTAKGVMSFSGTANYQFSSNIVPSGARTLTISFKTSDVTTRSGLLSHRDSTGGWFVTVNRSSPGAIDYAHNNTSPDTVTPTNTIQINTWYILCITYDDTTSIANIYLNGTLVSGPNTMSAILPTAGLSDFIAKEINSPQTLQGQIGGVFIYNRALSNTEVQQNFNATRGRYGL
jgi:hypothetical protein